MGLGFRDELRLQALGSRQPLDLANPALALGSLQGLGSQQHQGLVRRQHLVLELLPLLAFQPAIRLLQVSNLLSEGQGVFV